MSFQRPDRDAGVIAPRSAPPASRRHTTFARLVGAVGLVTVTALLFWLLTDDAFRVTEERISFRGLAHADEAEVRALLSDIDRGPNVFRVRASDIVSELSTLTEVDAAYATVTLPADVSIHLDERDPLFIWTDGEETWLVDEEGMLFASALDETARDDPAASPTPGEADEPSEAEAGVSVSAGEAARAALPVVRDGRLVVEPTAAPPTADPATGEVPSAAPPTTAPSTAEPTPEVRFLPEADLAVMRQLLTLTPEMLGSSSTELRLRVDQRDGYVLESRPLGWFAIFGRYTPSVQPPEAIPGQVQCLRWLLARAERDLVQIRLAPSDEGCGTFTTLENKPKKGN